MKIRYRPASWLSAWAIWISFTHICLADEKYPGRQAELEQDRAALAQCTEQAMDSGEESACTNWVVASTCAMTYRDNLPNVEKLVRPDSLQRYRIKAREMLPSYCDKMAAIHLDLEILDKDESFDDKERQKRWKQIIQSAKDISPEQRQIVAREAALSPEFKALLKDKNSQLFFNQCIEDAIGMLPDVSSDTSKYLHELEIAMPPMIGDQANALLMIDEIRHQQYTMARPRFDKINFSKISKTAQNQLVKHIYIAAIPLFGKNRLEDSPCFNEFASAQMSEEAKTRLSLLNDYQSEAAIAILRYEASQSFRYCYYSDVLSHFADIWNHQFQLSDVRIFADELIKYVEMMGMQNLLYEYLQTLHHKLIGKARDEYIKVHGKRIADVVISAIGMMPADKISSDIAAYSIELSSASRKDELKLWAGRLALRQKNSVRARQYWSDVIQNKNGSITVRSYAYELLIQSYLKDGKKSEADSIRKQYLEDMPSKFLHE